MDSETEELMKINNLIVETLHPDNLIAKIYNTYDFNNLSSNDKKIIIHKTNNFYKKNIIHPFRSNL